MHPQRGRALKNVAIVLAENHTAERVCAWLEGVALRGVDINAKTGTQGGAPEPVEMQHRIAAAKMLLERELGQPAQHLLLQAHVKAQLAVRAAENQALDPYDALDDSDLEALEALGRKLGIDPTRIVEETAEQHLLAAAPPGDESEP